MRLTLDALNEAIQSKLFKENLFYLVMEGSQIPEEISRFRITEIRRAPESMIFDLDVVCLADNREYTIGQLLGTDTWVFIRPDPFTAEPTYSQYEEPVTIRHNIDLTYIA